MDFYNETITLSTGEQLVGEITKDGDGRLVFRSNFIYKTDDEKWNSMRACENVDWMIIAREIGEEIIKDYFFKHFGYGGWLFINEDGSIPDKITMKEY